MEQAIRLGNTSAAVESTPRFSPDTTFVLFFLGVEIGRSFPGTGLDLVLSSATLMMFIVLPYVLPFDHEKPEFSKWIKGRLVIAVFALVIGITLNLSIGTILPEVLRYVPMTFLIASAFFSAFFQFYVMMKFRLAR